MGFAWLLSEAQVTEKSQSKPHPLLESGKIDVFQAGRSHQTTSGVG
jgi:hypothetical protein